MGAKTTKTLVREEENLKNFKALTGEMYNSSVRAAVFSSIYFPIVIAMGSIGTALALWFGGRGVLLQTIGFGTLSAFISYANTVLWSNQGSWPGSLPNFKMLRLLLKGLWL
jgi:ATP-binding cassette subfamily B protein